MRKTVGWFLGLGLLWCAGGVGGDSLSAKFQQVDETIPASLEGYATYAEMDTRLKTLAESPWAELSSLGETQGQRSLWLLKISSDPQATRPAILVVGNVQASHVVGRELALRMAERLVNAGDSPAIEQLLANYTVYIIPCPSPDATEKNFTSPARERNGNLTRTDDDRDFETGEDPPVDLNGDGWITMLRIADEFGTHRTHPSDPRVLIPIDGKKNEVGGFRLEVESRDTDQDKSFGEDASDGVDFNRNFTFNYPYFGKGSGPHQVSEIETRAVADFMFDHPNIAGVLCFTPEDNLFNTGKGSAQTDSARIKTKILTEDQVPMDRLAEAFRTAHGGKNAPESPTGAGSFSEWSYLHYGRWTFASRAWWVPTAEAPKASEKSAEAEVAEAASAEDKTDEGIAEAAPPQEPAKPATEVKADAGLAKDDKRGATELNALAWFESQGIDAFVPWQMIEHPDLPGKQVEVGGFKPFYLLNPPAAQIEPLVEPHLGLLNAMVENWPKLAVRDLKAKRLGPGLYDITCQIVNTGGLPTMPQMAAVNGQWHPIQVQLQGLGEVRWIQGSQRQAVGRLAENGGKTEVRWVFQVLEGDSAEPALKIQAVSPTLHSVEVEVVVGD
ncbi:MAG: M14 family metallopeptidase [Pirellulaceae bacterium]|nr:M14 family metallopeptidase [Pirellulaceae bacterium]